MATPMHSTSTQSEEGKTEEIERTLSVEGRSDSDFSYNPNLSDISKSEYEINIFEF